MKIKEIFDEIAGISGKNDKLKALAKYKDNELLKRVIYLAHSPRIKFYIKQIPAYTPDNDGCETLEWALNGLKWISDRSYTGHEASEWLSTIMSGVSIDDAYVIERIIDKNLKIGMDSGINKVIPKLIEETGYMGCVPFNEKRAKSFFDSGKSALSEVKADGRYVNVIITSSEVELTSRQGEPTFLGDCELIRDLSKLGDCVLNGELVMKNGISRLISNGIIASIIDYNLKYNTRTDIENKKKYDSFIKEKGMTIEEALDLIQLKVWDILSIEDFYNLKSSVKRIDRLNQLKNTIKDSENILIIENKIVSSYEEAMKHFSEMLEKGEEGTVLKTLDGCWKNGKPVWQLKVKLEMTIDLKVTGFNYGSKGTKNENVISSITCESSCGKLTANAQGLTEDLMVYVTENQEEILDTVIEVKCNGVSSNKQGTYSVFYPSFSKFRKGEKTKADSLEDIIQNENMVKGLTNLI
jgi:DNA ligase-1